MWKTGYLRVNLVVYYNQGLSMQDSLDVLINQNLDPVLK